MWMQQTPTATGLTAGIYTVVVTDDQGCTDSASVSVGSVTATHHVATPDVRVFPNPAFGRFSVEATGDFSVTLLTGYGQIVLAQRDIHSKAWLDVSTLSAGAYCLVVATQAGITRRTLILQ
jgi:hypothetical protein